ncbi:ParA family protein [Corynebacterium doosanense]|nr:ParA family protein [Corynebacterium doosanense]
MVNVISVIQTKGGTGKTTTAMLLSSALTSLSHRVLVLDADKQRSAIDWSDDAGEGLGFEVKPVPTDRTLETALRRFRGDDYDFILVDTPPGSNAIVEIAAQEADLVLVPTGVSPLDMKRTQATLDSFIGTETPVAVVLVNVDKREKLLDLAQAQLTSHNRAALADTIIPTRSMTRRAGSTVPRIETKPFREWMELAEELTQAF